MNYIIMEENEMYCSEWLHYLQGKRVKVRLFVEKIIVVKFDRKCLRD